MNPQRVPLGDEELRAALATLEGWTLNEHKLEREFSFQNFVDAFGFLTEVALISEKADHHPEIFNVYNRVRLALQTHDAGNRVTPMDVELARKISKLFSVQSKSP